MCEINKNDSIDILNPYSTLVDAYREEELNTEVIDIDYQRHEGVVPPFKLGQVDGIFILLLFCFVYFAHIFNGGITYLKDNYVLLFSSRRSMTEYTTKEGAYSYFLVFQAIILLSIALYDSLLGVDFGIEWQYTPLITIGLFVLLLVIYLLIKTVMYKLVGYIFDSSQEMTIWNRTYFALFELLGICLFLPTLILIYSDSIDMCLIYMILGLVTLFHYIYFYRRVVFFIKEKFNFLYLIAYLCTIEILPLVFLSVGLFYLYKLDVLNLLWLVK